MPDPAGDADLVPTDEAARRAAKRSAGALAGPDRYPTSTLLAPLFTGALLCSLLFDVASHRAEAVVYARGALWLVGIGIVVGVLVTTVAALDRLPLAPGTLARRSATTRLVLLGVAVLLFVGSFLARRGDPSFEATPWWLVGVSVVGIVLVGAATLVGVRLTYGFGVRVADEDDQRRAFVLPGPAEAADEG